MFKKQLKWKCIINIKELISLRFSLSEKTVYKQHSKTNQENRSKTQKENNESKEKSNKLEGLLYSILLKSND